MVHLQVALLDVIVMIQIQVYEIFYEIFLTFPIINAYNNKNKCDNVVGLSPTTSS